MKTIFLALCLFLFAHKATSVILDTNGQPVSNGRDAYYLIPVSQGNSGLGLAKVGNEAEPTAVVLDPNSSPGLPVRFSSPARIAHITEHIPLSIEFVSTSSKSEVWKVSQEFPIGFTVRVSDQKPESGSFRVQKARAGYKIVYYPDKSMTGADIGLVPGKGNYRLAVRDGEPLMFMIRKVASDESFAGIMSIV